MTNGLLSPFVAVVILAFGRDYLAREHDMGKLHSLQTLSAQANMDPERILADHGYLYAVILMGLWMLYMFLIEVLAFVLPHSWRNPSVSGSQFL